MKNLAVSSFLVTVFSIFVPATDLLLINDKLAEKFWYFFYLYIISLNNIMASIFAAISSCK